MIEYIGYIFHPDNTFLRYALIMGAFASVSFGIIGTFITTKRIGYLAGAISHSVFGGIGLAIFLQVKMNLKWFSPMVGATLIAVIAALLVGAVSMYAKEREDTIIGTIWVMGMASGLILIDLTPGYFDISSYLFGDIILISKADLILVSILDVIVVSISILFFNRFFAISFDSEFADLRGVHAMAFYILLLILTALTVVLMVRIVGIVLVIALLTIPSAIASFYAKRLWQMMLFSVLICMFFTCGGIIASDITSLSSGPSIIILGGFSYFVILFFKRIR